MAFIIITILVQAATSIRPIICKRQIMGRIEDPCEVCQNIHV